MIRVAEGWSIFLFLGVATANAAFRRPIELWILSYVGVRRLSFREPAAKRGAPILRHQVFWLAPKACYAMSAAD